MVLPSLPAADVEVRIVPYVLDVIPGSRPQNAPLSRTGKEGYSLLVCSVGLV
jgi:hypothetical protein